MSPRPTYEERPCPTCGLLIFRSGSGVWVHVWSASPRCVKAKS